MDPQEDKQIIVRRRCENGWDVDIVFMVSVPHSHKIVLGSLQHLKNTTWVLRGSIGMGLFESIAREFRIWLRLIFVGLFFPLWLAYNNTHNWYTTAV